MGTPGGQIRDVIVVAPDSSGAPWVLSVDFAQPTPLNSSHLLVAVVTHYGSGVYPPPEPPVGWTQIFQGEGSISTAISIFARRGDGTVNGIGVAFPRTYGIETATLLAFERGGAVEASGTNGGLVWASAPQVTMSVETPADQIALVVVFTSLQGEMVFDPGWAPVEGGTGYQATAVSITTVDDSGTLQADIDLDPERGGYGVLVTLPRAPLAPTMFLGEVQTAGVRLGDSPVEALYLGDSPLWP